jgi:tRNA(fMet)-specific endonuclease VapC
MGIILDSSLLIAAERQRFDLHAFHRAHANETFQIAAIMASELLHGVERAADAKTRARRQRFVEDLLSDYAVASFGLREAREHSRLWALLEASGNMIGPHDLLIAATALAQKHSLATLNRSEFQRVPGLVLVDTVPFATASTR